MMHRDVTIGAQRHQVAGGVSTAFGDRVIMVQVQAAHVPTDDALLTIAGKHRPPHRRRDGLAALCGDVCFQCAQGRRGQLAQSQFQHIIRIILHRCDLALVQSREKLGEGGPYDAGGFAEFGAGRGVFHIFVI